MNENLPYGSSGQPPPLEGDSDHWEPTEVVATAWDMFKANWGVLVAVVILTVLISTIPARIVSFLFNVPTRVPFSLQHGWEVPPGFAWGRFSFASILNWTIGCVAEAGALTVFIATARGQSPQIPDFFRGMSRIVQYLPTTLLWGLIVVVGLGLLVVPGVILGLGLSMATSFAVDRGMGPLDALRVSWVATRGQKGKLFLFYVLAVLVTFAGIAACCVGLMITWPVVSLAHAIIYVRLSTGRGVRSLAT